MSNTSRYGSAAEKQKAYRERQKAKQQSAQQQKDRAELAEKFLSIIESKAVTLLRLWNRQGRDQGHEVWVTRFPHTDFYQYHIGRGSIGRATHTSHAAIERTIAEYMQAVGILRPNGRQNLNDLYEVVFPEVIG